MKILAAVPLHLAQRRRACAKKPQAAGGPGLSFNNDADLAAQSAH
jgi:hypothetical protein